MMGSVKFWINMALVMATSYVMIWYVFKPIENQCQMTFMMEPPKFLPVNIDDSKSEPKSADSDGGYKLFMYSEMGFPMTKDIRKDLRDSVPILFVTGNAGSYQQVRSIASTCIRFQLHSLDAAKFIFYTIDFGGQLSGISGKLIERQIKFVQKSISKILSTYPVETDGLILIGHSVGGFISKALFTLPDFNQRTVPILISLASPLSSPYLNFDSEMRQLYIQTNEFWSKTEHRETVAVSISGGRSDHLVPMHLSMDDSYDISLTTNSIKDVWLATDHVSITWCREFIHKLAKTLSSLIDRKTSRLITKKRDAISIIKREMLSDVVSDKKSEMNYTIHGDWKITRPHIRELLNDFYSANRNLLTDKVVFLNLNNGQDTPAYFIYVSHIGPLRDNGIYACNDMESVGGEQINCVSKVKLMHLAQTIPSSRFEPKVTVLFLRKENLPPMNYIVLDYSNQLYKHVDSGSRLEVVPESLSVQPVDTSIKHTFYIPSLPEYLFKRIFSSFREKIKVDKEKNLVLSKYRLLNLRKRSQLFSIKFEALRCKTHENPSDTKILLFQSGRLSESFYLPWNKNTTQIEIPLSPDAAISIKGEKRNKPEDILEFYIDGSCENFIELELNLLRMAVDIIQRDLETILICVTYLSYATIVIGFTKLGPHEGTRQMATGYAFTNKLEVSGFILIYLLTKSASVAQIKNYSTDDIVDELIDLLLVSFFSYGTLAVLRCVVERIFDLAIIATKLQQIIMTRAFKKFSREAKASTNGTATNLTSISRISSMDLVVFAAMIVGSFVFHSLATSISQMFLIIRLELKLYKNRMAIDDVDNPTQADYRVNLVHDLLADVGCLIGLALISNIPEALLILSQRITTPQSIVMGYHEWNFSLIVSLGSLLLVQVLAETIGRQLSSQPDNKHQDKSVGCLVQSAHLIALVSTTLVTSDIRYINSTLLATLLWLNLNKFHLKLDMKANT